MKKSEIEIKVGRTISDIDAEIVNQVLSEGITDLTPFINQVKNKRMKNNIGHNNPDHLKQIASGIKALIEEQDRIKLDIADRYAEAKSAGFDASLIRKVLAEEKKREKNPQVYDEQRDLFDNYAEKIAPDLIKGE